MANDDREYRCTVLSEPFATKGRRESMRRGARAARPPTSWIRRIGSTAGNTLMLAGDHPIPLAKLTEWFEGFLPAYMAGAH